MCEGSKLSMQSGSFSKLRSHWDILGYSCKCWGESQIKFRGITGCIRGDGRGDIESFNKVPSSPGNCKVKGWLSPRDKTREQTKSLIPATAKNKKKIIHSMVDSYAIFYEEKY